MFSYVMKGKKSKCHHLVPVGLSVLAPHVCPHPLPTGFCPCLSSQLSPVLSKLSSLRFPEPGSLAPPPRHAATVSPRRLSPHHAPLTSAHLTLARVPWAHHQASPASNTEQAILSPYPHLNTPKAPSSDRG